MPLFPENCEANGLNVAQSDSDNFRHRLILEGPVSRARETHLEVDGGTPFTATCLTFRPHSSRDSYPLRTIRRIR
ncbi:protein of unknown function [Bradyrhizobium vignae]|uniref:Uncharacterized protein n=1 Tax=Bradyrhizobium vignae TaxID=1549949 RepID=A0A2U3PT05_9BRAD|nr:protein of unknown function [Bradyrhizobium vignae]